MNLYIISQDNVCGYDTYDSAVVAAEDTYDASVIHPDKDHPGWDGTKFGADGCWCDSRLVDVKLIGKTAPGINRGVIVASFNAG